MKKKLQQKILNFISQNFYTIYDQIQYEMMSHNEFEKVFSSSDMKIESEDWLFEIIYNKSPVFYYLYLYVHTYG